MGHLVRWKKEEDEFLKSNYFIKKYAEIGKILNRSESAVGLRCLALGLTKTNKVKVGMVFGKLTVVATSDRRGKHGAAYFICNCECGTIGKEITGYHLFRGETNSCGCLVKENNKKRRLASKETGFNMLEGQYKYWARKRDLAYELSTEQFRFIISLDCHYCGNKPRLKNIYFKEDGTPTLKGLTVEMEVSQSNWIEANGIDRMDNEIGYIVSNCVPCCAFCNKSKNSLSYQEFIDNLDRISNFRLNK